MTPILLILLTLLALWFVKASLQILLAILEIAYGILLIILAGVLEIVRLIILPFEIAWRAASGK